MRIFAVLAIFLTIYACTPEDPTVGGGPVIDDITRGSHWNLEIGSPAETVYERLQALGLEKGIYRVNLASRKPYDRPSELPDLLNHYDALTLQATSGRTDRIVLQFADFTVGSIERGGGLLDTVTQWPTALPPSQALTVGDSLSAVVPKLTLLYGDTRYAGYELVLPDKPLARPYDPDMASYDVWNFTFFENRGAGLVDQHQVRLHFVAGSLDAIRITRQRFELVN